MAKCVRFSQFEHTSRTPPSRGGSPDKKVAHGRGNPWAVAGGREVFASLAGSEGISGARCGGAGLRRGYGFKCSGAAGCPACPRLMGKPHSGDRLFLPAPKFPKTLLSRLRRKLGNFSPASGPRCRLLPNRFRGMRTLGQPRPGHRDILRGMLAWTWIPGWHSDLLILRHGFPPPPRVGFWNPKGSWGGWGCPRAPFLRILGGRAIRARPFHPNPQNHDTRGGIHCCTWRPNAAFN